MPGDHAGLSPALIETVAGLTAGSAATLAVHPLDIIKTRMQIHRSSLISNNVGSSGIPTAASSAAAASTSSSSSSTLRPLSAPPKNLTTLSLIRTLLQTPHPLAALYRGLTPNLLGSATSWASFFFFKDRAEGLILALKKSNSGGGSGGNDGESPAAAAAASGTGMRGGGGGGPAAADQQQQQQNIMGMITTTSTTTTSSSSSATPITGQQQQQQSSPQQQHPIATSASTSETAEAPTKIKTIPTSPTLTPTDYFLASLFGGACTQVLTNPIWVLKTRMVSSDASARGAYPNLTSGIFSIWEIEGFRGFYKGLGISLLGVTHGAVQFSVYDPLKRVWIEKKKKKNGKEGRGKEQQQQQQQLLSTQATLVLSSASKLVAGAATYPYQVIRSRMQNYDAEARFGKGIGGVARGIWREGYGYGRGDEGGQGQGQGGLRRVFNGLRGFYRGFVPGVVRVLPATWVTFLVYENVRFLLGGGGGRGGGRG